MQMCVGWLVPKRDLPTIMDLCLMDAVLAKVQVLTEDSSLHVSSSDSCDLNKYVLIMKSYNSWTSLDFKEHFAHLSSLSGVHKS